MSGNKAIYQDNPVLLANTSVQAESLLKAESLLHSFGVGSKRHWPLCELRKTVVLTDLKMIFPNLSVSTETLMNSQQLIILASVIHKCLSVNK